MRTLALPLLAAALLAACGSDSPGTAPKTDLVVRVDADGAKGPKPAHQARLSCPGAGCDQATRLTPQQLAEARPDQACTQIYGGPETATIQGTLNGDPVDASFSRTDGCQIARWQRVRDVLATASR
jgi:hypothetical protein